MTYPRSSLGPFAGHIIPSSGEEVSQFGYWCPWCEAAHVHGIGGAVEHGAGVIGATEARGAHCDRHVSPLAGRGVEVRIEGCSDDGAPAGPYLAVRGDPLKTRVRLRDVLSNGALSVALLRAVFGRRAGTGFDGRLAGGVAHVVRGAGAWWLVDTTGKTVAEGHDLGGLLSELFSVPLGVVAVRVLEDALGLDLKPDVQLALAEIVDQAAESVAEAIT